MSQRTDDRLVDPPANTARLGRAVRRTASLARAEVTVLRRNLFALGTAIGAPVLLVLMQLQNAASAAGGRVSEVAQGTLVVASITAFAMIFSLYYILVTALVARREALVLKRLRSGEIRDGEIVAATAVPALIISAGQIFGATVVAAIFLRLQAPTNPLLLLAAVILGSVVFAALAAVTTALARTVELAQLTAAPLLIGSLMSSGLMIPIADLPPDTQPIANLLPLTPVVDLLNLGLSGTRRDGTGVDFAGSFGAAAVPLLILSAWAVLAIWGARTWFRWEPRR